MHSSNRVYLKCCSTWSAAVFHLSLVAGSIPDTFVGECHKWKCEVMKEWTEDLLTSYWDQFGPSVGPVAPWADACTPVRYCACRFHFNIPCLLPKLTGMSISSLIFFHVYDGNTDVSRLQMTGVEHPEPHPSFWEAVIMKHFVFWKNLLIGQKSKQWQYYLQDLWHLRFS